ncbi:MAG: peptidylprolyl isomerase, partial [Candidatus Aegiribacteria sp.]|nr:peptidylprolyl isomerase [Candidatus Aegiribacteria sp.]
MTALLVSILLTLFIPLEKIVAVVGNSPILHSEVEQVLVQMGQDPDGSYEVDSETPEYHDTLEELIDNRLIVNAAVDAGFYPTEDEIQVLVDEELNDNPPGFYVDIDYLSEVLADNQAAQIFIYRKIQAVMQDMPLDPETYLVENAEYVEELIMPRHLGWIYLPILPSGPDFDEFVEEMDQIRERIFSGESFEELAMEYSDDGSAMNGGYLGSFGPGEMTYAFEDAAFSLETGEISEPVVTPFGIHIIRLDGRNEDGTIEASHILRVVPIDPDDIDRTVAEADSILCDIRSTRLSFEDAARVYSRDRSSSESGGDMGMIPLKLWL